MTRPNQCFLCSSRCCHLRIYTSLARPGGPLYDELACRHHEADLSAHARDRAGVPLTHLSSTAKLRRAPAGGYPNEIRQALRLQEALARLDRFGDDPGFYMLAYHPADRAKRWEVLGGDENLGAGVYLADALLEAGEAE